MNAPSTSIATATSTRTSKPSAMCPCRPISADRTPPAIATAIRLSSPVSPVLSPPPRLASTSLLKCSTRAVRPVSISPTVTLHVGLGTFQPLHPPTSSRTLSCTRNNTRSKPVTWPASRAARRRVGGGYHQRPYTRIRWYLRRNRYLHLPRLPLPARGRDADQPCISPSPASCCWFVPSLDPIS